jgi:Na+-driven multidrug efflux pump
MIFNFIGYLFSSLPVSVVTAVAEDPSSAKATRAVSSAMALALVSGVLVALALEIFSPFLVEVVAGCSPEVVVPALTYMRIRALASPALLVGMIAQVVLPSLVTQGNQRLPRSSSVLFLFHVLKRVGRHPDSWLFWFVSPMHRQDSLLRETP